MGTKILDPIRQCHESAPRRPTQSELLLIRLYKVLLKLYPLSYHLYFADDMLTVFTLSLREAVGTGALLAVVWREVRDLLPNVWQARRQVFRQLPASARRVRQARLFVRIIGSMVGLFLLSTIRVILSPNYNLYPQAVPFVALLFMTSLSLLLALRWERTGGLLIGGGGVCLGMFMSLYLAQMATSVEACLVAIVLIGLLWMLPFVIFGGLFYHLSWHPKQHLTPS